MSQGARVIDRVGQLSDWDQPSFSDGQVARWSEVKQKYEGVTLAGSGVQVFDEELEGIIDGVNDTFTVADIPVPLNSFHLYKNGLRQRMGVANDYVMVDNVITFNAGAIPVGLDILIADYTK